MKIIKVFAVGLSLALLSAACNSGTSKADSWSSEQKSAWSQKCLEFMAQEGVEEENAKGFCDCMLTKTSEKYTPEEAAAINEDEERKLWAECDYNW